MVSDHTQDQSPDERRRAKQLSLAKNQPPAELAGYALQHFLGRGAFGEVWVGTDLKTGRRVAVKFFSHRQGVDWQLLSREVEKLRFLSADRYVVQLLDIGWDNDPPYYVMEYIDNGSLEDLIRQHGPLPIQDALPVFEDIVSGVVHAHAKGILHCDIKPANILLDGDHKPRLADFGQSRMTSEQRPALGTLFFMAPEQADLEAIPDAQWDVYALGAVMYYMLTGELPYRNEGAVREMDSAKDLHERLEKYRTTIKYGYIPNEHRRVAGVDRALGDIIDRCLARHPEHRYKSAQEVLAALEQRKRRMATRPLVVLGFVGPLLLLAIAALFTARSFYLAMEKSEKTVFDNVLKSNESEALTVSVLVANTLERYFEAVDRENSSTLQAIVEEVAANDDLQKLIQQLGELDAKSPEFQQLRNEFDQHPERQKLQKHLKDMIEHPHRHEHIASWIVMNEQGTQLASAFAGDVSSPTIGKNYAYRTYFHGGIDDLEPGTQPSTLVDRTHLSAPLQSTATYTWKVAVSTPIRDNAGETIGVLALTMEIGKIVKFPQRDSNVADDSNRYLMLVDGRPGKLKGLILQHRLYETVQAETGKIPARFAEYRLPSDVSNGLFVDPVAEDPLGKDYDRQWIAARQSVRLDRESGLPAESRSTQLYVLVVEDYNLALQAVHQLGDSLAREMGLALLNCICVAAVLWYFVSRRMVDRRSSNKVLKRTADSEPTPIPEMTTLAGSRSNIDT